MILLIYLIYCFYPYISGRKDAVLWSGKSYNALPIDEHIIFFWERIDFGLSAFIPPLFVYLGWMDFWDIPVALLAMVISFPFFHNGSYYKTRFKIDGRYGSWFDYSFDYKSFWNFRPKVRTLLFIASLIILVVYGFVA